MTPMAVPANALSRLNVQYYYVFEEYPDWIIYFEEYEKFSNGIKAAKGIAFIKKTGLIWGSVIIDIEKLGRILEEYSITKPPILKIDKKLYRSHVRKYK